jgi:hypothetical protein
MGDVRPIARLVLVLQWPQQAIKSAMCALIARLRCIIIEDAPERAS